MEGAPRQQHSVRCFAGPGGGTASGTASASPGKGRYRCYTDVTNSSMARWHAAWQKKLPLPLHTLLRALPVLQGAPSGCVMVSMLLSSGWQVCMHAFIGTS